MRTLITALAAALPATASTEIVYLPEGSHKIRPQSHKDGVTVKVPPERGDAIAAALQADLNTRLGQNVQPWFDFEHTRKYPSAGKPVAFRYEKGRGVMCTVEWSSAGRRAIRGRDVGYFSPEVYIGDDGVPNGLPERGPLGGLVMEPAFREIPPVTASDADTHPDTSKTMSAILILASIGLLTQEEASAEGAESLARQRLTAMKTQISSLDEVKGKLTAAEKELGETKTKLTAAETKIKEANEKRADDLVKAAIADGRLAPKDETKAKTYREKIAAGDSFAEEVLKDLPKVHEGLDQTIVTAGAGDRGKPAGQGGEHAFITEAKRLVTAKQAEDEEEAMGIVASEKPDLYKAYVDSL